MLHCWCLTGFWLCLWFQTCPSSEYSRTLNIPLVLNMLGFWTSQGSEHASGSKYARVLNNSHIYLIMPEYVWIWLDLVSTSCFLNETLPFLENFQSWELRKFSSLHLFMILVKIISMLRDLDWILAWTLWRKNIQ